MEENDVSILFQLTKDVLVEIYLNTVEQFLDG